MIKGKSIRSICRLKNVRGILGTAIASLVAVSFCVSDVVIVTEKTVEYNGKNVYASEEGEKKIKTINLGTDAISNPKETTSASSYWGSGEGSYIYYGKYNNDELLSKDPIKWRVLSVDSDSTGNTSGVADSILLSTDKIVDVVPFNSEIREQRDVAYKVNKANKITSIKANDYSYSDIRYWLNSDTESEYYNNGLLLDGGILAELNKGFLKSAFSEEEIVGIKNTSKDSSLVGNVLDAGIDKDKVFLLSSFEANNPKYGFAYSADTIEYNISRRLEYTIYAKTQVLGITQPTYQLRTVDNTKSDYIHYVYEGSIVTNKMDNRFSGVVPAINLDKEKIVYVSKAGLEKKDKFSMILDGSDVKEWVVTLQGSEGFEVAYSKDTVSRVRPGSKVDIEVTNLPEKKDMYNQISAMIVDKNNTIIAYGKVDDKVEKKSLKINIPYEIEDGNYELRVFAEKVNSSKKKYMTDYASNMAKLDLTVSSAESDIIEKLEKEKKEYHEIDATLYDTDEYAKSGDKGNKLTEEGIEVTGWKHTESKYLQIDVKVHNTEEACHVLTVEVPKEMYYVGDITAVPAGCTEVSFVKNEDIDANGGALKYDVNNKSGVLKYYIAPNTRETSIQVELRYDKVLWDKREGVSVTAEDVMPVSVAIEYEPKKGEKLDGGVLTTAKISKVKSGSSTGRFGYFTYHTDKYDLSKNNTKDLRIHVVENNQVSESLYFDDAIFEIHIPYWTDTQKVKHYLKYDINTIQINKSFFKGKVNYEVVEQKDDVVKIRVENLYYTTTQFLTIPLTFPDDIETEELFLTFTGGKFIIQATSVNGEEFTHLNSNISNAQYCSKYEEYVVSGTGSKSVVATDSNAGVMEFGGFYLENKGVAPSCKKNITIEFPKELLVTTINLPADLQTERFKIRYKLVDENSETVYLDERGMRVSKDSKFAHSQWELELKNGYYKTGTLDNVNNRLYRDMLPQAHRRYYFKEISYTIESIKASARLYIQSGQWGLSGTGNYMGYLGKDVAVNGKYVTQITVTSPKDKEINDLVVKPTTTVVKDSTVPYGIDSTTFSAKSITAGEEVTVSGSMFVTNYPYGNSQMLGNIRIGLVLSKGVSVDANNIILYTQDNKVVDVKDVTYKDIGNNQLLWMIDADPNLYIGYADEKLGVLARGNRLSFSVPLKTSKRLESTTLFTDSMLYCTGLNVRNASGGSYNWANSKDIWDMNENGIVTDNIGKSYYTNPATCNIVPSPPSLDIEDTLEVKGEGEIEKGIARICKKDDLVLYNLNIQSLDDGTASSFQYFIPIPKQSSARDPYLILSDKSSSFDFSLTGAATLTGDEIYKIDYCFEKGVSYVEMNEIEEDKWFTAQEVLSHKEKTWEDVTTVRLRVEGLIEKGVKSTISLPLVYGGENFVKDSGQLNSWRSSGYYEFDSGTRFLSGHFKSPGVKAEVDYSMTQSQSISFIAKGVKDNTTVAAVQNTFPENRENIDLSDFPGADSTHTLTLTDIEVNNAVIKSKKFMVENQHTLTSNEADKFFGFTLAMRNEDGTVGTEIDLSEGTNQEIGKFKGTSLPVFDICMYYGSNFKDVGTQRSVTITIESNRGIKIKIEANIFFATKNRIDVINGENTYMKGEGQLTKVFYIYAMKKDILKNEMIEFVIDKTNDVDKIDFALSTSNDYNNTGAYVPTEYVTLLDDRGAQVSPKGNIYQIEGDRRYTIKLSKEYMLNLMHGEKMLYLHSHVPTLSSVQEVMFIKRSVFEEF